MEEQQQNTPAANKLLRRLDENLFSLTISRVPQRTKKAFIELANEEFCGDYGMTLKWLVDQRADDEVRQHAINEALQSFDTRITEIENSIKIAASNVTQEDVTAKEKRQRVRMCDGSTRTGGREQ